jgi:hypothetical protein
MGSEVLTYELGDEVGRGALARVVRVVRSDGQVFAGKILHTSRAQDAEAVDRFRREAELVAPLRHDNITGVYGFESIDGLDVLLMELVEGPTLAQLIARESPLSLDRIVAIGRGLAAGLAAAHGQGVVHRDLKPANVLVAEGDVPKIADFGMARASTLEGVDPSAFTVLGTPDYMAPEGLDPLAVDARSDLYALGCILYELCAGHPPFQGATVFGVLEQHRRAAIPALDGSHPQPLRALVEALLAKAPADRPQSADAVARRLGALADDTALVWVDPASLSSVSKCASCGAPLVAELGVCLSCGLATPRIEAGDFTLFVTGPGKVAEKFDSALRQRVLDWVHANPSLGLNASALHKRIPRLPFVFVTGVSEASGRALAASIDLLGVRTELTRGGRYSLPAIRKKARTVAGRTFAVVAASSAWVVNDARLMLGVWAVLWLAGPVLAGAATLRSAVTPSRLTRVSLPAGLRRRLSAIETAGAQLRARRHRESLRGVVGSALALRAAATDEGTDEEIEQALDIALVAAGRLDALDAELESTDLQQAGAEVRAKLSERDRWSSRLLDLHATIEMLRSRVAAADVRRDRADDTESLDELRAKVEALEEVQST